ncbi:hypothetical protein A3Q35_19070 [Aeribacillus pallidus]|nr:hypothetical protein A3Q35_19070 [Aeribacillus pallidus]
MVSKINNRDMVFQFLIVKIKTTANLRALLDFYEFQFLIVKIKTPKMVVRYVFGLKWLISYFHFSEGGTFYQSFDLHGLNEDLKKSSIP